MHTPGGDTVIRPRTGIAEIVRVLLLVLGILLPDGPLGAFNTQPPRERDARRVKLDAEHAGAHVLRDECDAKADGAHAGDEGRGRDPDTFARTHAA